MITQLIRGALGKCPNCGNGQMADGLFRTHPECSHCGLVYQGSPGDFTGASVLSYGVTSVASLGVAILLLIFTELSVTSILLICLAVIFSVGILTYPILRGIWVGFLVSIGWLIPPEDPLY